ncbi:hypothetical protein [Enteractinococcus helveticum]|uniref:Phage holin family protein n=1 Tax=Enteractinococcus helveticum TaxID=1837282 RepID=A0A1B7LXK3_9MICC|nr:hypothetical protein [Enteractinococcus helveticum]OAV59918.1 hypothetical protein A6F49_14305 [Enteractinococcus helveticum]
MVRWIIRTAMFLGSAMLGIVLAWLLLDDFRLSLPGFVTAVIVFAVAQSLLSPLIEKAIKRYAEALLGGVELLSTFVALLIASLFPGGLQISEVTTWVLATLVVWLVTALGTWLLPLIVEKQRPEPQPSA